MLKSKVVAYVKPSNSCNVVLILWIGCGFLTICLFYSLQSDIVCTVWSFFEMMKEGEAHLDNGCHFNTPIEIRRSIPFIRVAMCVRVFSSSGRRELPSDVVPTARRIHPPPMPATSYPYQTPHQPFPEEMLADECPLGNVDGTATANFVGTIPWSPSDIPPGASLCDT
jgi:hypothetical protein